MPGTLTKVVAIAVLAVALGGSLWYLRLDAGAEQATLSAAAQEDSAPTAVEVARGRDRPGAGCHDRDREPALGRGRGHQRRDRRADQRHPLRGGPDGRAGRPPVHDRRRDLPRRARRPPRPTSELSRRNQRSRGRAGAAPAPARSGRATRRRPSSRSTRPSSTWRRTRLDKTRITAPFGGMVGLRQVSVGEYVTPGQDLVDLEDIDPIKVDFRIPERFLSAARGRAVDRGPRSRPGGPELRGRGLRDRSADRRRRAAASRSAPRVDNHGAPAAARPVHHRAPDHRAQRDKALLILEQAVFAQGGKQFVYEVVDGTARLTEIRLGDRRVGQVEITAGLEAGDVVVTAGQMKLRDGAKRARDRGRRAGRPPSRRCPEPWGCPISASAGRCSRPCSA